MASATVLPEQAPEKAAPGPSGLLSKFARSSSRKHKPRPSSESIEPDVPVPTSKPTRIRPRPGTQRTTTAPDAPVTLNAIKAELSEKDSVAKGQTPTDGDSNMEISSIFLAETVRRPDVKIVKPKEEVPEMPSLNGAQIAMNPMLAAAQMGQILNNPNTLYQHIHDMSSKRIATLDYMRRAHEGRMFWFNTVQFSKSNVSKLPSYTPARLSKRAANYLLLGMSIPAVLDIHPPPHPQNTPATNAAIAQEYLKSLNSLLAEFESFQQLHPPDGSSASSLSRARLPQMFKRATTTRPRKSSGAPVSEIGMPLQQTVSAPSMPETSQSSHQPQASLDTGYSHSFASSATTLVPSGPAPPMATNFSTLSSFPPPAPFDAANSSLLPNEGPYTHLLTPPLPFPPDFFVVFSTLCDVLIDAYHRILQLLSGPNVCTPVLSDTFSKVDARIRKVMVGGIVREFENSARDSAKRELMGVQKVVFSGLM